MNVLDFSWPRLSVTQVKGTVEFRTFMENIHRRGQQFIDSCCSYKKALAGGVAAALAARQELAPRKLNVKLVQQKLQEMGAVLFD
jgi:hypothetical protein